MYNRIYTETTTTTDTNAGMWRKAWMRAMKGKRIRLRVGKLRSGMRAMTVAEQLRESYLAWRA